MNFPIEMQVRIVSNKNGHRLERLDEGKWRIISDTFKTYAEAVELVDALKDQS